MNLSLSCTSFAEQPVGKNRGAADLPDADLAVADLAVAAALLPVKAPAVTSI
jgi:hypothetical protein